MINDLEDEKLKPCHEPVHKVFDKNHDYSKVQASGFVKVKNVIFYKIFWAHFHSKNLPNLVISKYEKVLFLRNERSSDWHRLITKFDHIWHRV